MAVEAFTLTALTPQASEAEWKSGAGRGVSEETLVAESWLRESWKYKKDGVGKQLEVTVPAGQVEKVTSVLSRAANRLGLGKDIMTNPLKGGKVLIVFRARIKRERKVEGADAE